MTREEAKQNLIALGIVEPADEVVTNYLNQFHAQRAPQQQQPQQPSEDKPIVWTDTDEYKEMQKQIEDMRTENVKKDIKAYAVEKGLSGEQAEKILAGLSVDLDTAKTAIDSLSAVITDRETAAAQRKEQEIANGSTPPNSGTNGNDKPEKTDAEKWVESHSKARAEANAAAQAIVDSYK